MLIKSRKHDENQRNSLDFCSQPYLAIWCSSKTPMKSRHVASKVVGQSGSQDLDPGIFWREAELLAKYR